MKVYCSITSKFGGRYKAVQIARVQNYAIETSLDNDSDSWSLDIGDPSFDLMELLYRDSEIRVQIVGGTSENGVVQLKQGFADIAAITHDGLLALSGRDVSCTAVDSTHPPFDFGTTFPQRLVTSEARSLGFSAFDLKKVAPFDKFYTDGSESYWQMWYRMYRARKMYMWVTSNGTLRSGILNVSGQPKYLIGYPDKKFPNSNLWIRPSTAEIRKNVQARLYRVDVYGETGAKNGGIHEYAIDSSIKDWVRRPLKIITEASFTKNSEALDEAKNQIFDSKVGSIEIMIQVRDPGYLLQQNELAYVNIPDMGFNGIYFIVGVRAMSGPDGMIQELRLREKSFAISKRIPQDPVVVEDQGLDATNVQGSLSVQSKGGDDWGDFFMRAALHFHGTWDLSLFLGVLLAICRQETNFQNEREGHFGIEWYPLNSSGKQQDDQDWYKTFANAASNPLNNYNREAGVGPMQLTDLGLKKMADDRINTAGDPEYYGGRWDPESNIWVGAYRLASALQGVPRNEPGLWSVVGKYNGSGPSDIWTYNVKKYYYDTYKDQASEAVNAASQNASDTGSGSNAAKLIWPFATKSESQYNRIDQGWDLQDHSGAPVYAIQAGTVFILNPDPNGFGNDYPVLELDEDIGGPSNWIYYGHVHCLSSVAGKHVKEGQLIAYANTRNPENGSAAPPGWLEIGFARPGTDAPAQPAPESVATEAGRIMKKLLLEAEPRK